MPHHTVDPSKPAAGKAAVDPDAPEDPSAAQQASARTEPRTYAAHDVRDSSLALPAAGEISDYMDEGDALGADDVQQGSDHRNRPDRTEATNLQGPKTLAGNREKLESGSDEKT